MKPIGGSVAQKSPHQYVSCPTAMMPVAMSKRPASTQSSGSPYSLCGRTNTRGSKVEVIAWRCLCRPGSVFVRCSLVHGANLRNANAYEEYARHSEREDVEEKVRLRVGPCRDQEQERAQCAAERRY